MHLRSTALDPTLHSANILSVKSRLLASTIGQDQAVDKLISVIETYEVGYSDPQRPLGVLLFLGPTGTGKTRCRRPEAHPKARAGGRKPPSTLPLSAGINGARGSTSMASRSRSTAAGLLRPVYRRPT
jgi:hypothetical protein